MPMSSFDRSQTTATEKEDDDDDDATMMVTRSDIVLKFAEIGGQPHSLLGL